MTKAQIDALLQGWTDSRLLLEIDQAAAQANDGRKSNDEAWAATAALLLMLEEKKRRGL